MMAAERLSDGTLKVLALETAETPVDSIQNGIIKKPSEIASLLTEKIRLMENRLEQQFNQKYEITNFYTAINGRSLRSIRGYVQHSFAESTEIGTAELSMLQKDLKEKIDSDKEIYYITNEEYIIDGDYIREPNNIVCREIAANYLVVAGRADIRENFDKCIDRVALNDIKSEALAPLAMADAVLTDEDKQNGVVHINFGYTTTTITVFQNSYLRHLAVVPFGGKHVTNDIRFINEEKLRITQKEAEQLKTKYAEAVEVSESKNLKLSTPPGAESRVVNTHEINQYANARLAEIVMLCKKEIERSGYADQLSAGIVITGGQTRMAQFQNFIEQETNMVVRFGSFAHYLDSDSVEKYSDTEYTLLIGLLTKADQPSVVVKQKEEEDKPIEPKKKDKKRGLGDLFRNLTLFDDPDSPTIQD